MQRVTVELADEEMALLEAVARARHVQPADVLKAEALKLSAPTDILPGGAVHKVALSISPENEAREQRRQARLTILMRSNGIFSGKQDKPKDGLVYQKELRAEWQ
jgi:hypothetical protein